MASTAHWLLPVLASSLWIFPVTASAFVYDTVDAAGKVVLTASGPPVTWECTGGATVVVNLNNDGDPPGQLDNGTSTWDDNIESALAEWNKVGAGFHFRVSKNPRQDPCATDGVNSWGWSDDSCGDGWGDASANTLVQKRKYGGQWFIVEADIRFNRNLAFNAYSGPIVSASDGRPLQDFYRVALHETGHVLGLGHPHELGQKQPSIMSYLYDGDILEADDQAGIRFLYPADYGTCSSPEWPLGEIEVYGEDYSINGGQVTLRWQNITNYRYGSGHSGALRLRLWATLERPDRVSPVAVLNDGYLIAEYDFSPSTLTNGAGFAAGSRSVSYTEPPAGSYAITLGLVEWNGSTYELRDHKTFDAAVSLGNGVPVANSDTATATAGSSVRIPVLANDSDPEGGTLSVTAVAAASAHGGSVVRNGDGTVTYTAPAGYSGSDTFTYTVSDGTATATGTVTVTVTAPTNGAPHAVNDAASATSGASITLNVLANDTDPEGDSLSVTGVSSLSAHGGSVVRNGTGTVTYTAPVGYSGSDTFTYTVSDGTATATGTVTVTVTATNPTPAVDNDHFTHSFQLTASTGEVHGTNQGASVENAEPRHADNNGGASVWWRWVAPATGNVAFTTSGSTFDTLLAVYTGSRVDDLVLVAANDDLAEGSSDSLVTFAASAGQTYRIAVDGYDGATGDITLQWQLVTQSADTGGTPVDNGGDGGGGGGGGGCTTRPDTVGDPGLAILLGLPVGILAWRRRWTSSRR